MSFLDKLKQKLRYGSSAHIQDGNLTTQIVAQDTGAVKITDGADFVALTNASLNVDVTSSALPDSAATETTLNAIKTQTDKLTFKDNKLKTLTDDYINYDLIIYSTGNLQAHKKKTSNYIVPAGEIWHLTICSFCAHTVVPAGSHASELEITWDSNPIVHIGSMGGTAVTPVTYVVVGDGIKILQFQVTNSDAASSDHFVTLRYRKVL